MNTTITTLCYMERDGKYLMLHRVKKQIDVNKGKWIGVGGKLERGESPEECLIREVREETGFELTGFRYRGLITFVYADKDPEYIFTYTSKEFFMPMEAAKAEGAAGEENVPVLNDTSELNNTSKSDNTSELNNMPDTAADINTVVMPAVNAASIGLPVPECDEGIFAWIEKDRILTELELWEGDRYMLNYLLKDRTEPFSLKLCYDGQDRLIEAWELSASPARIK